MDMDSKHCDNMPLSQRAKQFAPFQALSMLSAALKQVEDEHENKVNTGYCEQADAKHEKNGNNK